MLDRTRVREIYAEASALPEEDRAPYLDRACAGEPSLRAEVDSLLAAAARRPDFLASPTAASPPSAPEGPGTWIGPYRLLQEIGQGGFGTVYMAEQEQPVRRRVALKIIKLGMDTKAVIARFEAERQALALMDHANIAKVLDAGATDSGRPYFVMELVKGDPITRYCDRESLSIAERLDLFQEVCAAVQHAHSKGVIHRDIKPSNMLVATQDGRPHAKVIDFGIAKATEHRLTERTLFTEFRQLIGTPEYMSPEQAEGSLDIDTRSDVYSLGVLLYELLTGTTPFDPRELRSAAYTEIQRIIREVEPPKPSTRLSQSATLQDVAAHRRTDPARLSALVRGDLDWIVMKALDKDRARRYETPSALAADLARHLAGEPVAAVPPSPGYRLRKFVRRNRAVVTGGVIVGAALLVGVGGLAVGLLRAGAAERRAQTRADELERVAAFQAEQLQGIDPRLMGARLRDDLLAEARASLERTEPDETERTARLARLEDELAGANFTNVALDSLQRNIFDRAIEAIDREFADQPLVRARLLSTVGDTLRALGLHARAVDPQARAWEIFRSALGDEDRETLRARGALGRTLLDLGRVSEAAAHVRAVLEAQTRLLGEDDPDRLTTLANSAQVLLAEGKAAESEACNREALERRTRVLGEEHPDTLITLSNLAAGLQMQGRFAEAEPLQRKGLEWSRRVNGEDDPHTLGWLNNLATTLEAQGELDEAAPYQEQLLETSRRVLGDDNPDLLPILNNMGASLARRNRPAEAEPIFREALARMRRVLGDSHENTLMAFNNLGHVLRVQGRLDEAAEVLGQGAAGSAGVQGVQGRALLVHHYASALQAIGRLDEAKAHAVESLDMYRAHPDWNPLEAAHAEQILRDILVARAEHAEAEALIRRQVEAARAAQPPNESAIAGALISLGVNLISQGRCAEAEPSLRECLEIRTRILPEDHPDAWLRYNTMSILGGALTGEGADGPAEMGLAKFREAEPLLLDGYNGMKDDPRVPSPTLLGADRKREALMRIIALYEAWEHVEPGVGHADRAAEWHRAAEAPEPPR